MAMRSNTTQLGVRALLVGVALLVATGCVRIDSGGSGVMWTFTGGTQEGLYGEGVHIVAPWNRMFVYDVRTQDRLESLNILTSNGLSVKLEVSVRYKPVTTDLYRLHAELGPGYYDKILKPVMRSEVRKVVGKYKPEDIYSGKRLEIEAAIFEAVRDQASKKYVDVEAVLVRDVGLPEKLRTAISDKLEEEQRSLKMQFVLEREKQEAERKRIEAKGISDFQKIVSQGINQDLLRWKGIEATEKLAGSDNSKIVVIGSGKDGLPLILGGTN